MTFLVKGQKHRHRVVFKRRTMAGSDPSSSASRPVEESLHGDAQHRQPYLAGPSSVVGEEAVEFVLSSPRLATMSAKTARASMVPDLFTSLPYIRDLLNTQSSQIQEETIQECLPFLSGLEPGAIYNDYGVPHLERKRHIQFLHKSLKKLPAPYVAADASRPWMFYWALAGLSALGEDVSQYREPLISTVRPIQNATGGFGGGNGQMSHLAPTYAIVLALAIVGGEEALDIIDRRAMWKWLGALKQLDGGFQVSVGGEEDIRYELRMLGISHADTYQAIEVRIVPL
jgi:protein farnesyltransferase subunit beta